MYLLLAAIGLAGLFSGAVAAHIPISGGTYSQNFDSLGSVSNNWINNLTLPGWYASKGSADATNYLAGAGTGTTGGIYSFGTNGVNTSNDRALGSLASSSFNYGYGVRFTNDTAEGREISISFTGEQWRSGTTVPQVLAFSFQVGSSPITNAVSGTWTNFSALNFTNPNPAITTGALDGNAATNRTSFTNFALSGVIVNPGQEIFLRWLDIDDNPGSDSGLAIDDVAVSFSVPALAAPTFTLQPTNQTAGVGDSVTFTAAATGNPPPAYQWRFNNTDLLNETNAALALNNVTTNLAGSYLVVASNSVGTTNSLAATLTVTSPPPAVVASKQVSYLHYNVKGNGATDWSTNAPQVLAIARQLAYLNPDIIAFNEIPYPYTYEMTNFVNAFLPGYYLATNSGTDVGAIRSVIVSRYPIVRSTSWLDGAQLEPWGYTNSNFTRDLFEAEITVPGFAQPLHVFTTHLKSSSGGYTEAAAKRAAEAAAITNFFATNFFALYPLRPYILSGDLNEADTNTLAIQRLLSAATGLQLTNPTNPVTGSINTYSTAGANPSQRIDYILPGGVLGSNIAASQVFRTDRLSPVPPNLFSNDCKVASDHLPVFMSFSNPYLHPIRVTALNYTAPNLSVNWITVPGGRYRVETSTNLVGWTTLASNLTAASGSHTFTTNISGNPRFFRIRAP